MKTLTIIPTTHENISKPFGYDVIKDGVKTFGSRRWKSAQARDAEVNKVVEFFSKNGYEVEVMKRCEECGKLSIRLVDGLCAECEERLLTEDDIVVGLGIIRDRLSITDNEHLPKPEEPTVKTKTLLATDADTGNRIGLTIRAIPAQPGVAPALVHIQNGCSWSMCLTEADATKLFQALAVVIAPAPAEVK